MKTTKISLNKLSILAIVLAWNILTLSSCKKDSVAYSSAATINVVNSAINVATIKLNLGGSPFYYSTATSINYGSNSILYAQGQTNLRIVNFADTTTILTNTNINFQSGVYSIYIAGQAPNIDTLIRRETNYPFIHNDVNSVDSSMNIRFVNLSPNSIPVSINIKNSATQEVAGLGYKGLTSFKNYSANYKNASYIFEIRDGVTNTLLASVTVASATYRFKNVVLLVKGLEGTTTGTNAFGASVLAFF